METLDFLSVLSVMSPQHPDSSSVRSASSRIDIFVAICNARTLDAVWESVRELFEQVVATSEIKGGVGEIVSFNGAGFASDILNYTNEDLEYIRTEVRKILCRIADINEAYHVLESGRASEEEVAAARKLVADPVIHLPSREVSRVLVIPYTTHRVTFYRHGKDLWQYLIEALEEMPNSALLRRCKICEKVYVARRKDSATCSPRHANRWRQRVHYARRRLA